jgi:hypothetical protein
LVRRAVCRFRMDGRTARLTQLLTQEGSTMASPTKSKAGGIGGTLFALLILAKVVSTCGKIDQVNRPQAASPATTPVSLLMQAVDRADAAIKDEDDAQGKPELPEKIAAADQAIKEVRGAMAASRQQIEAQRPLTAEETANLESYEKALQTHEKLRKLAKAQRMISRIEAMQAATRPTASPSATEPTR